MVFMSKGIPFSEDIKTEIVNKIKNEGMSVREASVVYDASPKAIYSWLRGEIVDGNRSATLEIARLKKELDMAYRMLGKATALMSRPKS